MGDKSYRVYLQLKERTKKDIFVFFTEEIKIVVKATSISDACLKAEDYFSQKLGMALIATQAYQLYAPEDDEENDED